ncbi:MAG TPA: hypothetical protein VGE02_05000 [Gemmatimonadales bacterium]
MSTIGTLATPWMLMIDASGAVSPANDSASAVASAAVGGGGDAMILGVLVVAIVAGVSAMVAGDARRRAREERADG